MGTANSRTFAIDRIDTPQSPYELSRALEEMTGGQVSTLTLGRPQRIEGVEGEGMQRHISARIDDERKSFVAKVIGGRVTIHEGGPEHGQNKMHEFLKRVDEARKQRREKAQAEKTSALAPAGTRAGSTGTAQTASTASPVKKPVPTPGEQAGQTVKPTNGVSKAAGWPTRGASPTNSTHSARASIRRR